MFVPRVDGAAATRQCGGKHRYKTKRLAIEGVKTSTAGYPLFFYKCKICRGFHLTKRPPAPRTT